VRAAQVLQKRDASAAVEDEVSSQAYFLNAIKVLRSTNNTEIQESICVGYISSAGMGSESVVQNSRMALLDFIDTLPDHETSDIPEFSGFSLDDLADCLLGLLKSSLNDDRILLPLLEVISFLFDMQVMQRLQTSFK
jgi:hypothetical protein